MFFSSSVFFLWGGGLDFGFGFWVLGFLWLCIFFLCCCFVLGFGSLRVGVEMFFFGFGSVGVGVLVLSGLGLGSCFFGLGFAGVAIVRAGGFRVSKINTVLAGFICR